MGQYGFMLLVVINNKKSEIKESGEKTAQYLTDKMEVPESSGDGGRHEKRSGEHIRPTPD
jgi:hypothetical protein